MKVDFYVLETNHAQKAWLFACQWLEKAYAAKQKVYVHHLSQANAEKFDSLLWTFREDSFIPHGILQSAQEFPPPIQIGYTTELPLQPETLLHFCEQVPPFYDRFQRVIEIVFADPDVQQLGRERFKFYRSLGCDITTHKIKVTEL